VDYAKTTLAGEGYPAKRPWYPLSNNVYQEIIPAAGDGYPYNIKILFNHMGAPTYSCPAGHKQIEILKDVKKIPLFISSDIIIGETTMYADYVFPDVTFMERFGTPHVTPDVQVVTSKVRQPVAPPATEVVKIDGEEMHISMEAVFLAIGKKMKLSGFGKNAFEDGMDFNRPEDYFLKLVANIGYGDKPEDEDIVPDASNDEIELFKKCRRFLPKTVYDYEKWKNAVKPEDWKRTVYVLNRGGRFEQFAKAYKGDKLAHQFKNSVRFYLEDVAAIKNSGTGENFLGYPIYDEPKDFVGNKLQNNGYDLQLITYKEISHAHTRTISNYWNLSLMDENWVMINSLDAKKKGLRDGDIVRITSSSNPDGIIDLGNGEIIDMTVKVKVAEGVRPGVASVSHHFGHWAYGGKDIVVDGATIKGDKRRIKGITPNPLMLVDPVLKNSGITDPIGASASFFESFVKLVKV
jgi:anaerobic selenocysteine-containing dehydrogenase